MSYIYEKCFEAKFVEKIETRNLYPIIFFQQSCHLRNNVEKWFRAGQATDDNMTHAHSMLDKEGYK